MTYERVDDWHVAGLAGTGSNSVRVKDAVVPAHRFISLPALLEGQTPPRPRRHADRSQVPSGSGARNVSRDLLAWRGAPLAEEFLKNVPGKRVMYTSHIAHEWSALQIALGEAASMIEAAELIFYRAADDVDTYARRGEKMPMICAVGSVWTSPQFLAFVATRFRSC